MNMSIRPTGSGTLVAFSMAPHKIFQVRDRIKAVMTYIAPPPLPRNAGNETTSNPVEGHCVV